MVRAMRVAISIFALLGAVGGCEHGMTPPGGADDQPPPDAVVVELSCPGGHRDKIQFGQSSGCANDGGVEFCIPDDDPTLLDTLAAISPSITCAPGGGRANCARVTGLLLCSYPTAFPNECLATHGAMTVETWGDMCSISDLPVVLEIVPTILD